MNDINVSDKFAIVQSDDDEDDDWRQIQSKLAWSEGENMPLQIRDIST